ncbi:hypothetical protein [Chitinilyticum piscinae]|uniref:Nucleotidyltransferase n=1 Tax=Chitinilyticum piscinae TaxID=2866724 RepID=A0A8J7FVB4_9NEIS|nr:hypothetical protein [Chitinilyticum piscinae]MBE9607895.1 hypothetical protein [Chitinilyticum piscinae]
MSRHPNERAGQLQRQQIAQRAARLVAEEHIHDLATAKRKAARQLGFGDSSLLPSNDEIVAALDEYRQLLDPEHAALLLKLRQKAAYLLHFFAQYRPYLCGSVLTGHAGAHSNINLQLFQDDPKSVELFLLNQQIDYDIIPASGPRRFENYPSLAFWFDGTPVRLQVLPSSAERNPASKADRERLNLNGLRALLHAEAQPASLSTAEP